MVVVVVVVVVVVAAAAAAVVVVVVVAVAAAVVVVAYFLIEDLSENTPIPRLNGSHSVLFCEVYKTSCFLYLCGYL